MLLEFWVNLASLYTQVVLKWVNLASLCTQVVLEWVNLTSLFTFWSNVEAFLHLVSSSDYQNALFQKSLFQNANQEERSAFKSFFWNKTKENLTLSLIFKSETP